MSTAPAIDSPFHEGELCLQSLVGVREAMEQRGRAMIRDHMPDQHRRFFEQLPFVLAGGLDAQRQPWATVWAGLPGFMQSPDPQRLDIQVQHLPGDPLAAHWQEGSGIGLLGMEPHTRRRNRMNGTVQRMAGDVLEVAVRQSFGNCPKYIHPRQVQATGADLAAAELQPVGAHLQGDALRIVSAADTFFIASASPAAGEPGQARGDGVDVSHRGGPSGFVHVAHTEEGSVLTVPDYVGNFLFNTLGNIMRQPRVGLLFMDVARGDVLWLAGRGEVDLDPQAAASFAGAQRLLRVRIDRGTLARAVMPLVWDEAPAA